MRPLLTALFLAAVLLQLAQPVRTAAKPVPVARPQVDQVVMLKQSSRQARPERVLEMTATAYTNSPADTGKEPGDPDYGITFTGTRTRRGTVAVDPRVIPLGTRLWVEGYGPAVAEDVGGAVRGNMVDVFLGDEAACREWGRRKVEVRAIE